MANRSLIRQFTLLLGLSLSATTYAAPIVDPTLSTSDSYYVGSFNPNSLNPTIEAQAINVLITKAVNFSGSDGGFNLTRSSNAGPFASITIPLSGDAKEDGKSDTDSSATTTNPFAYVVGKYSNIGSHVWYFADGFTGTITLPGNFNQSGGNALSHITLFNPVDFPGPTPVPEASSVALWCLAGLSCLGMTWYRRRK